jgi:hypothetical protein
MSFVYIFVDMRRAVYGTWNYELPGPYRKHLLSFQVWDSKTVAEQDDMVKKLINDKNSKNDTVKSTYTMFERPRTKRLAPKLYQTTRPKICYGKRLY